MVALHGTRRPGPCRDVRQASRATADVRREDARGQGFFAGGGQITKPAGSTIAIRFGDSELNLGMLQDFLQAEATALTLNGGTPIDVSSLFGPPTEQPDGTWRSTWTHPTGITPASLGDTLTFTITTTLSRLFAESPRLRAWGPRPTPPLRHRSQHAYRAQTLRLAGSVWGRRQAGVRRAACDSSGDRPLGGCRARMTSWTRSALPARRLRARR